MKRRLSLVLATTLAVGMVAAGCGGNGNSGGAPAGGDTTSAAQETPAGDSGAGGSADTTGFLHSVQFADIQTADFNDPDNFIYTFFGNEEKTTLRSINYGDTDAMARVSSARAIVDEAERIAEYQAMEEKIIQEDAAWVPMYSRAHLFAVSTRVQNFVPVWSGIGDKFFNGITLTE